MPESTPGNRRQRQKAETRRLILRAAYECMAEVGYAKTTLRAVATRAGVGLGTIFKHVPDKPALLVAAYQEDLGAVVEQAMATLPRTGLIPQLEHLTSGIYDFYASNPLFARDLLKESLFLDGAAGVVLQAQLAGFLQVVAGLIARAIQSEALAPDTDPALGAQAYGAFYLGGLVTGLSRPEFDVIGQVRLVGALCARYFYGVNRG